ncbi:hypothetical protein FQN57_004518 [Myotisia sp. PD_48]|nr:hypothetical protein FQN57_004518 [Myotisia sp. PD_48]
MPSSPPPLTASSGNRQRPRSPRRQDNAAGRARSGGSTIATNPTRALPGEQCDNGKSKTADGSSCPRTSSTHRKRRLGSGSSEILDNMSRTGVESPSLSLATSPSSRRLAIRQLARPMDSGDTRSRISEDTSTTPDQIGSSSSPSMTRQLNSLRHQERSFPDYGLPRWQPDAEVSECPICSVLFTFWCRKHHCRKCGRVVCAACSPHRITIPRQFIVRPPDPPRGPCTATQSSPPVPEVINLVDDEEEEAEAEDESTTRSSSMPRRSPSTTRGSGPGLGGGEEVRLCNPCVPDPNPAPPRRYTTIGSHHADGGSVDLSRWNETAATRLSPGIFPSQFSSPRVTWDTQPPASHRPSASMSSVGSRSPIPSIPGGYRRRPAGQEYYVPLHFQTSDSQDPPQSSRNDLNPPSYTFLDSTSPRHNNHEGHFAAVSPSYPSMNVSSQAPHRQSHSSRSVRSSYVPSHATHDTSHSSADRNRPLPRPPIAQPVDERDFCPICNRPFPPQRSGSTTKVQEEHIRACIERHAVQTRPDASNTGSASERLRMLSFTATEKDCTGTDGVPQECTICMEEYEVGAELARLECLCKFHKTCIIEWFERKEECPVHKVA